MKPLESYDLSCRSSGSQHGNQRSHWTPSERMLTVDNLSQILIWSAKMIFLSNTEKRPQRNCERILYHIYYSLQQLQYRLEGTFWRKIYICFPKGFHRHSSHWCLLSVLQYLLLLPSVSSASLRSLATWRSVFETHEIIQFYFQGSLTTRSA